jgi:hypothetical protein
MKAEGEPLEEKVEADGPVHGGKRAEEEITIKVAHEDLEGRVLPFCGQLNRLEIKSNIHHLICTK